MLGYVRRGPVAAIDRLAFTVLLEYKDDLGYIIYGTWGDQKRGEKKP